MRNIITFTLLILSIQITASQSIFGKWKTLSETGKTESIIKIYKKNGQAYGKIIEITSKKDRNRVCDKCEGENKNKPLLGLVFLKGLKLNGKQWEDGEILDPKSGKIYNCYVTLINNNKLKIRGYIGFSLLGRTEYWYRVKD